MNKRNQIHPKLQNSEFSTRNISNLQTTNSQKFSQNFDFFSQLKFFRTFAQKEQAYAEARKRILGITDEPPKQPARNESSGRGRPRGSGNNRGRNNRDNRNNRNDDRDDRNNRNNHDRNHRNDRYDQNNHSDDPQKGFAPRGGGSNRGRGRSNGYRGRGRGRQRKVIKIFSFSIFTGQSLSGIDRPETVGPKTVYKGSTLEV